MNTKQRQVYNILITPILSTEQIKNKDDMKIQRNGDKIESTQIYKGSLDPDMSDFAIGFYRVLYPEISEILNGENIKDCCFAGDTMNSFNSIANITPGAGKSKNQRETTDEWQKNCHELFEYYNSYHCLANFCILPMCIGRKSMKLNKYDSMDIFLKSIQDNNYDSVMRRHGNYYNWIDNYEKFIKRHFLEAYRTINETKYNEENALTLIQQAMNRIKIRAEDIAMSEYSEKIWKYFEEHKLINQVEM